MHWLVQPFWNAGEVSRSKSEPRQGVQQPLSFRESSRLKFSPKQVAAMLHARRVTLGLSSEQLGRMLNVNGTTIRNWEAGAVPVVACRILSWLFAEDDATSELWKERALIAESALRDVRRAMEEYRDSNSRRVVQVQQLSRQGGVVTRDGLSRAKNRQKV